ncbi:phosphoric ester hydrolase-like protein [Glonium stellatum]|uniref:Phosphoric ester hydrolase-like protein n=1 Tax=Glonium stellatum TaxID=574774 RepID=A0A8E2EPH0_9PEZI|nr:phosphoric ester hydrolase-like protein [Glonium stellatum]
MFSSTKAGFFREPTQFEQFQWSPLKYVTRALYHILSTLRTPPKPVDDAIRIVCISDTHNSTPPIPDGDVLIHAGDLTENGTLSELQAQIDWLSSLPHTHKVAIAGNHDTYLDPLSRPTLAVEDRTGSLDWKGINYLQSTSLTLTFPSHGNRALNVYGAPHVPLCGGSSFAFQYPRHLDHWTETIPSDTNILVTHSPPRNYRDNPHALPSGVGCAGLLRALWRVKPRLHVFGHVHAGAGRNYVGWDAGQVAYDRVAMKKHGGFREVLSLEAWRDLVCVAIFGLKGILTTGAWAGERKVTVLVNAATYYDGTNLDHSEKEVQVVLL